MPRYLFDSSVLIEHFNRFPEELEKTEQSMRHWAAKLIEIHSTKWICSPVVIEVLAGTRNQRELELHRAFLSAFEIIDGGKIPPADWEKAAQLAQRVPANRTVKARDLGECLIRAIAERLNCDVLAFDKWYRGRTR